MSRKKGLLENIKIKKRKLTPKTYIKNELFKRKTIVLEKKRKKISNEDFEIPEYSEYKNILNINYNVSQLKKICAHYKQKKTGNKQLLIHLLYNYLYYSYFIIKIQSKFRGYIRRKLNKLKGPSLFTRKCTNETDFFTLENLDKIPYEQFFSFIDKDGFTYGFDICSLYNMVNIEKCNKNPYNRNPFPDHVTTDTFEIITLSKVLKEVPKILLDDNIDELSKQKQIELRAIGIFQKIDECGFISNADWFVNLNHGQLRKFLRELFDIWNYRAQIGYATKKKIDPLHCDPFFSININVLVSKCLEVLQNRLLDIMEIFVSSGEDKDSRSLGTYYVLGGLTIVSSDAAQALPWLYESFIPTL